MYHISKILAIALIVFLTGCSIGGEKKIKIFSIEKPRAKLDYPLPTALELEQVKWIIITSENAEEVFARWDKENEKKQQTQATIQKKDVKNFHNNMNEVIDENAFDTIVHEHLEYYHLGALEFILSKFNLKVVDIQLNDINGGSYRIFCRKFNEGSIKLAKENVLTSVKKFAKRVKKNKSITMKFINKEIRKGKKIFLYGASTKGNTLLQYYYLKNILQQLH